MNTNTEFSFHTWYLKQQIWTFFYCMSHHSKIIISHSKCFIYIYYARWCNTYYLISCEILINKTKLIRTNWWKLLIATLIKACIIYNALIIFILFSDLHWIPPCKFQWILSINQSSFVHLILIHYKMNEFILMQAYYLQYFN